MNDVSSKILPPGWVGIPSLEIFEIFELDNKYFVIYEFTFENGNKGYTILLSTETPPPLYSTRWLTFSEVMKKKDAILNNRLNYDILNYKTEDNSEEIIKEDIVYMEGDEFNEGYYYNIITGKIIR